MEGGYTRINTVVLSAKCHIDKFKRFGCIGYALVHKPNNKFSEKVVNEDMAGYSNNSYVFWHPPSGKFLRTRNSRFNEKLIKLKETD